MEFDTSLIGAVQARPLVGGQEERRAHQQLIEESLPDIEQVIGRVIAWSPDRRSERSNRPRCPGVRGDAYRVKQWLLRQGNAVVSNDAMAAALQMTSSRAASIASSLARSGAIRRVRVARREFIYAPVQTNP